MTQRNAARKSDSQLTAEALEARDTPAVVGALDPTFVAAAATTLPGITITDSAVQTDGKVVVAGTNGTDVVVARYTAEGALDTSFNATGIRVMDAGGAADTAKGVVIQGDGKVVVVGTNGADAFVARFRTDGSLDTSFAGTGLKILDFGGTADTANDVVIQGNKRIVVTGSDGADFAVARFNPADGTLDTSFNLTGMKLIDLGGAADVANALAIHPDGSILMAGTNGTDFAFARVTASGDTDTSFDADGKRIIDAGGGADSIVSLVLQSDGKIVAAGNNGADMILMRLEAANGENDNSFNSNGMKALDIDGVDTLKALTIQGDGKLVAAGSTGGGDAVVARLNADGSLDTAFGSNGVATFDLGGADSATSVAATTAGRLIVTGQSGADAQLLRLVGALGTSTNLTVGGSLDGSVQVYTPSSNGSLSSTATLTPFGGFYGVVRTATGDVDGDGIADTVAVTGPGTGIGFAVVSGKDNKTLLVAPTAPFSGSETFTGGGFVSVGDMDNDGRAEIVITPDQGGGGRVVIFSLLPQGLTERANFFGIVDPMFRGGARSAVGDINNDGYADLVVSAGFGGGPRVALYDGKDIFGAQAKLVPDFYAFPGEDAKRLRNGSYVTIGDLNGDGYGDLIFGGGPGGASRVFALSGQIVATGDVATAQQLPVANFFAGGESDDRGGVRVAAVDLDHDNKADLVTSSGDGLAARVRVYTGDTITSAGEPPLAQNFNPFNNSYPLKDGVFVG